MKVSKLGILSAVIASICCAGPLLLIVLGLGSLGLGAAIGRYHWYFIAAALLLLTFAWKSYLKEKKVYGLKACKIENKKVTLLILILSTIIVAIFAALNIYAYVAQRDFADERTKTDLIEVKNAIIPVEGMTCFTCEIAVLTALKRINGVISVSASAKKGIVHVSYNPNKTDIGLLMGAINKTGYKASLPN